MLVHEHAPERGAVDGSGGGLDRGHGGDGTPRPVAGPIGASARTAHRGRVDDRSDPNDPLAFLTTVGPSARGERKRGDMRLRTGLAVAMVAGVVLAACGGDDDDDAGSAATTTTAAPAARPQPRTTAPDDGTGGHRLRAGRR